MWRAFAVRCGLALSLVIAPAHLNAEVVAAQITARTLVQDGVEFGAAGRYELLQGRVFFAIDPAHERNRIIVDLDQAPRNAAGKVEMSADLVILKPKDGRRGNGSLLLDVVNRGSRMALGAFNAAGPDDLGDGFLLHHGYTLAWVGWQFDVPPRPGALRLDLPAPVAAGLGYAAVRDTVAWLKHATDSPVATQRAIAFGSSQSGRFLRSFLYLGFNADERQRQVFDGVMAHIAGASQLDLNRRGATPMSLGQFDATPFPFADAALRDPVTGVVDGLLDNARARTAIPKIFYTNSAVEYWGGGRSAALLHTTPDGRQDLAPPPHTRVYFLAGTQHVPARFPPTVARGGRALANPADYTPVLRALLLAMDAWLREGLEPPPSRYPRLADGTLVPIGELAFPALPDVSAPRDLQVGMRAANPLLPDDGGASAPLPYLVPQTDADGNELAGVRLPEIAVPLATHTGWQLRDAPAGGELALLPLVGAYHPLPATPAERAATRDSRAAITERYPTCAQYLDRVRAASAELVRDRYLLEADLPQLLDRAARHWQLRMGGDATGDDAQPASCSASPRAARSPDSIAASMPTSSWRRCSPANHSRWCGLAISRVQSNARPGCNW